MKIMNCSSLLSAAFTVLLGMTGYNGTALATTPDGETPANEGVCDMLIGATPGLYGLCNAYCEAQDLNEFDKEPPRTKILENYNKKKQDGDPDMPCIQAPCPCWTPAELYSISADGMAVCVPESNKIQIINTTTDISRHFAEADINAMSERCRYLDLNTSPPTARSFSLKETPADAQVCYDAIVAACDAL
jgi:hypothetical protein